MSTAAKLIEDVRGRIGMVQLHGVGESPALLVVGEHAHLLLSEAAGWRAAHRRRSLPALYGVRIAQSGPGADWRLLDSAGTVIAEGELTGL